jgi:hypothetical protein
LTDPKERHWDYVDRIYAIPEGSERDAIIAEELREFASGLEDGTIHVEGSPRWTEGAHPSLALDFSRPRQIYQ